MRHPVSRHFAGLYGKKTNTKPLTLTLSPEGRGLGQEGI
jgi:hypothetical protein